jgi:hypothetical protein
MVITRLDRKAEKSETEEEHIDAGNRFWYSGHFWIPIYSPRFRSFRLSRAHPRIRLDKINMSARDLIAKACILIPLLDI